MYRQKTADMPGKDFPPGASARFFWRVHFYIVLEYDGRGPVSAPAVHAGDPAGREKRDSPSLGLKSEPPSAQTSSDKPFSAVSVRSGRPSSPGENSRKAGTRFSGVTLFPFPSLVCSASRDVGGTVTFVAAATLTRRISPRP